MICPICKRSFERHESNALPFCAERCRTIDLGRWLDEGYSVPHMPDPDELESLEGLPLDEDP